MVEGRADFERVNCHEWDANYGVRGKSGPSFHVSRKVMRSIAEGAQHVGRTDVAIMVLKQSYLRYAAEAAMTANREVDDTQACLQVDSIRKVSLIEYSFVPMS